MLSLKANFHVLVDVSTSFKGKSASFEGGRELVDEGVEECVKHTPK
jgi:hypothetical protein